MGALGFKIWIFAPKSCLFGGIRVQNALKMTFSFKKSVIVSFKCQRPYHIEHTSSRLITEVKQCWVQSVLGWVTAWEHWMLLASLFCIFWFFFPIFSINLWYCLKCLNFAPKMCKMPYNQKIYFWKSMIQKSSGNTFFTMTKSCFFSSLKIQSFFSKLFINWRNFSNFKDLLSIF